MGHIMEWPLVGSVIKYCTKDDKALKEHTSNEDTTDSNCGAAKAIEEDTPNETATNINAEAVEA